MFESDLSVEKLSSSLNSFNIDVLITGSIGAVESVRFLRALRRLGAQVFPHLSAGAKKFVTVDALEWASGGIQVGVEFEGKRSHLAEKDALIVAPTSANFIAKLAHGVTDSPGLALAASYLGSQKPVLILPNMHDSLYQSPMVKENIEKLRAYVTVLDSRNEEGKQKFPDPRVLADEVSHCLNKQDGLGLVVTMGSTKAYIDDIRYISNYSSGALGSRICEEVYRQGINTYVLAGACRIYPQVYTKLIHCSSNEDIETGSKEYLKTKAQALVCAASLLDYDFKEKLSGKVSSADTPELNLNLKRTHKVLKHLDPPSGVKVGFKLEPHLTFEKAQAYAKEYMSKYQLSQMILNQMGDVGPEKHKAYVFSADQSLDTEQFVVGKMGVAKSVAEHVKQSLIERGPH